ncbi:MAG: HD domain-containing protein [Candidatus Zixiibacteriota bacterium]
MNRSEAYQLVEEKIGSGNNLLKHIISVEAVMRRLAEHFGADPDRWGMVGLLHDLDYVVTANDPERHTFVTSEWLKPHQEIDDEMIYAIHCHADHKPCLSKMDWALYATDPTTGLITAAALMNPARKLSEVQVSSLMKRFKDKRFAAGARREGIAKCSELGLTLEEFLQLSLDGMRRISDELGL